VRFNSWARVKASRHAKASRVAGEKESVNESAEAPMNVPFSSRHTTATTPPSRVLATAASVLILTIPGGGGSHLGGAVWLLFSAHHPEAMASALAPQVTA
jgi:hypothetical protein